MAGASTGTLRVTFINANWKPGIGFQLMVVTEDEGRHEVPASAEEVSVISTVASNGGVFLWDPEDETVILANILGNWIPEDWSSTPDGAEQAD